MLYNNKLSQEEHASIEWSSLLLDIKTQIIDYLPAELWEWFAIHDNEFYEYSLKYRNYYINKYTVHNVMGNWECWKILGLGTAEFLFIQVYI
jgi:hypothetical protein